MPGRPFRYSGQPGPYSASQVIPKAELRCYIYPITAEAYRVPSGL